jgi:hypothetical protein
MQEIEIKDVQNIAQNMIVGSKQHTLFDSVRSNNPNLISGGNSAAPEYGEAEPAGEEGLSISKISVDTGGGKLTAVAVGKTGEGNLAAPAAPVGAGGAPHTSGDVGMGENLSSIAAAPQGLNSHLYGMLKPCSKQYNKSSSDTDDSGPAGFPQEKTDESN